MNTLVRKLLAGLLALVMLVGMAACTDNNATNDVTPSGSSANGAASTENNTTKEATPAVNKDTVKIALSKNPTTLDGQEGNMQAFSITNCIFEHLCVTDKDGNLVPQLATSWEQVDECTVRFNLRDDVTFSDGSKFNAETAAYTVNWIGTKEPRFKYYTKWGKPSWPCSAEVESEYSVLIRTAKPNMTIPAQMTFISMYPLGAGEDENFQNHPVGTGPYKLESWDVGVSVTLTKRDDYWGECSGVKTLIFDVVADESARSAAMKNGEYDIVQNVSYDDADALKAGKVEGMYLQEDPSNAISYIYFSNLSDNAFIQNPDFRKAMTYAIDYKGIETMLCNGYVVTSTGCNPNVATIRYGYNGGSFPERDVEKARQLAKECGYNGEEILMYYSNAQFARDLEISETIISQLVEAGFNIRVEQIDSASWSEYKKTGNYDLALNFSSGTYTGDTEYYYVQAMGTNGNWSWEYADELLNKCYESGITAEQRGEYLTQIMQYAWEMTPNIWCVDSHLLNAVSDGLNGFQATQESLIWVKDCNWN